MVFQPTTSAIPVQAIFLFYFRNWVSCIHNCDDLLRISNLLTITYFRLCLIDKGQVMDVSSKVITNLWMECSPPLSHVHRQATGEVDGTLREQELSCHSQSQLLNHCHKLTEPHCVTLWWCYLQADLPVVSVLRLITHDPGICERCLLCH